MNRPVIYVEDEEDDVIIMEVAWKRAGMEIPLVALNDGEQAIDYLNGVGAFSSRELHPLPCLMLLDLNLPRKSGLEVLTRLRQMFDKAQLPVVMFSSSDAAKDKTSCLEAGANSYIVKPTGLQQLTSVVASLLTFLNQPVS